VPFTLYSLEPDARATRIRGTLTAATAGSTPGSAIVRIRNRGFQAKNVTFENSHNKEHGDIRNQSQAVAVLVEDADRAHFENVRFIGFQDTLFLASSTPRNPSRTFLDHVYVEGDMDFIFGEATAYFRRSEIRTLGDRAVSYTLAPSTHRDARHGFVFEGCRFTHDGSAQRARRPLQARPPVVSQRGCGRQGRHPALVHRRAHRPRAPLGGLEHRHAAPPTGAI
jgi:pectin methylesterase-like acyl-CoA thioesterase